MIMDFLKKVPAGMMIVPMFISAIFNTFFADALQIGSFTTAVFTSAGSAGMPWNAITFQVYGKGD